MANIWRNDLTIEGPNVQLVLDAIGFKKSSTLSGLNEIVLIDTHRLGHEFGCQWPMRYGGAQEGDVLKLTDNKVSFKFYTRVGTGYAQPIIWALSKKFFEYKFTSTIRELSNGRIGGEVLVAGEQTVYVDIHGHDDLVPEIAWSKPPSLEPCKVPDCTILFPTATPEDVKAWYRRQEQDAKSIAEEEFKAEAVK